jgi:hypothetical protein
LAVFLEHDRLHELVGLATRKGGFHRGHRILRPNSDAAHHGVVGHPGAIPSAVPVHRVIAPDQRRDDGLARSNAL